MTYTRELLEDASGPVGIELSGNALRFQVKMERRSNIFVELRTRAGKDSPEAQIIRDATLGFNPSNGLKLDIPVPDSVIIHGRGGSTTVISNGGGFVSNSFVGGSFVQVGRVHGNVQIGNGNVQVNQFGSGRNVHVGGNSNALVLEHGIDVTVYLPQDSDVYSFKGNGLNITGRAGLIETDFSAGDVIFQQAGELKVRTSGGDIRGDYVGWSADARTSGGSVLISEVRGPIELRTSGGNVSVGVAHQNGSMRTSGGNVRLEEFHGTRLRMKTSGGNISHPEHPGINAETSGGRINGKFANRW